jgi:hypothetical protein
MRLDSTWHLTLGTFLVMLSDVIVAARVRWTIPNGLLEVYPLVELHEGYKQDLRPHKYNSGAPSRSVIGCTRQYHLRL